MKFLVDAQLPRRLVYRLQIAEAFEEHDFVELGRTAFTIHE
jgi:predicted nuclease of predicted toxin-antitoxin system